MKKLASALRAAQLHAHTAHNLIRGQTFFADHAYLGELYAAYEEEYDHVIERIIGLDLKAEPDVISADAADNAMGYDYVDANQIFLDCLSLEAAIRDEAERCLKDDYDSGTQNMLQGICDKSLDRAYKLNQRTS